MKLPDKITMSELVARIRESGHELYGAYVQHRGRRRCWTSMGWVDAGEPRGDETVVEG